MERDRETGRQGADECYHCGLPIPPASDYLVTIDGQERRMCCAGCEYVAEAIVSGGLTGYYQHRDAMPNSPREAMPLELQELGLFDHPDVQKSFVRELDGNEREATLILEGITCAACVWLNEQHIASQPGVVAADVNYATRRARVRWNEEQTKLSHILSAVQAIGYRAHPYDADRSEQVAQRERRTMLWRLALAGLGMMQVMMYAYPSYIARDGDLAFSDERLLRWASLILTLPVVLYSSAPFFQHAWRDLRLRRLGMDVPVALGVGSAFVASVWATLTDGPHVYFESVTMFVFLLLCGRYLEMEARQRAVRGVEELGKVLPAFAERLVVVDAVEGERVPVTLLSPGELVRVSPGQVIPVDGLVVQGQSEVNEALLTGESRPVAKAVGDGVTGGSINIVSPLVIEVARVGDATRLAQIRRLMERAASERPRVAALADRAARIFIPTLLVLAALTYVMWLFIDAERALWIFVSVLVVACPCALSLATPTALTVASDALARMGVLVTRGHAVETLARSNHFVFDKTGTLTYGQMRVVDVVVQEGIVESDALALAAALELGAEHAVALAVREHAAMHAGRVRVENVQAQVGRGVAGMLQGDEVRIGRPDFIAEIAGPLPAALVASGDGGETVVALGRRGAWLALFVLADLPREEAGAVLRTLHDEGVAVTILSGDGKRAVATLAAKFAVQDFHAELSPDDKLAYVSRLQQQEGKVVAMVGDGVNDAPVLAQAHVSVAMGGGTDLARNQADVVLLAERLDRLHAGVMHARKTLRVIRQNLVWSFLYNFLSVPFAMAGWITPWMAGLGMALSSLLVVLNALRLRAPVGSGNRWAGAGEG